VPGNSTLVSFHHVKELNFVLPGEEKPKKSAPATFRQYTKLAARDEWPWSHAALSKEAGSKSEKTE